MGQEGKVDLRHEDRRKLEEDDVGRCLVPA
jgi:hypothetical protein